MRDRPPRFLAFGKEIEDRGEPEFRSISFWGWGAIEKALEAAGIDDVTIGVIRADLESDPLDD